MRVNPFPSIPLFYRVLHDSMQDFHKLASMPLSSTIALGWR